MSHHPERSNRHYRWGFHICGLYIHGSGSTWVPQSWPHLSQSWLHLSPSKATGAMLSEDRRGSMCLSTAFADFRMAVLAEKMLLLVSLEVIFLCHMKCFQKENGIFPTGGIFSPSNAPVCCCLLRPSLVTLALCDSSQLAFILATVILCQIAKPDWLSDDITVDRFEQLDCEETLGQ